MEKLRLNRVCGVFLLSGAFLLTSCHSSYKLANIQGSKMEMTNAFDASQDAKAVAILAPFKAKVDSIMNPVIGSSAMDMTARRPESLLSNLIADVLREYANAIPGHKADIAITNMGGLRSNLPKGNITFGTVYEILPFENSLCIVTLKGSDVKALLSQLAMVGGEGISNAKLLISKPYGGQLIEATVGGKPIDELATYSVATLDYLAEGNDGLGAFNNAISRYCPQGATIRNIFLEYVKAKAAKGEQVLSALDGRIEVKK